MTIKYYPKIVQFHLDRFGISETFFDAHIDATFLVVCDAINLKNPEQNNPIARSFEKIIKQYIYFHWNDISEKTLRKAIEYAQHYFLKNYLTFENQLKISLVIIAFLPDSSDTTAKLLITGVGDIKIYQLDQSLELFYYDSEISHLPENLSNSKRFHYITNAIGAPELNYDVISIDVDINTKFLIATYGSYHQTSKEKLYTLFADPELKKNHVHKFLTNSFNENDHTKLFSYITLRNAQEPKTSSTANLIEQYFALNQGPLYKRNRLLPIWLLKIVLGAVISLLCLECFNYYLHLTKTSVKVPSQKGNFKEIHTIFNVKTLKKPLELPFLKERAYIIDLKEKYDQKVETISKLQQIVNEQDKTLRNLQVKKFYQYDKLSKNQDDEESDKTQLNKNRK